MPESEFRVDTLLDQLRLGRNSLSINIKLWQSVADRAPVEPIPELFLCFYGTLRQRIVNMRENINFMSYTARWEIMMTHKDQALSEGPFCSMYGYGEVPGSNIKRPTVGCGSIQLYNSPKRLRVAPGTALKVVLLISWKCLLKNRWKMVENGGFFEARGAVTSCFSMRFGTDSLLYIPEPLYKGYDQR